MLAHLPVFLIVSWLSYKKKLCEILARVFAMPETLIEESFRNCTQFRARVISPRGILRLNFDVS